MTATNELRRMLTERGVEWDTNETLTDCWTRWNGSGNRCTATEINGGFSFSVGNATPEQAIAATLGAGTCKVVESEPDGQMWVYRHEFSCSCGQRNLFTTDSIPPRYCPNCGRKVEG